MTEYVLVDIYNKYVNSNKEVIMMEKRMIK